MSKPRHLYPLIIDSPPPFGRFNEPGERKTWCGEHHREDRCWMKRTEEQPCR